MTTQIKEYSTVEAALAELEKNYAITNEDAIKMYSTPEGIEEGERRRKEIKGYRVSLEKKRKNLGEEARKHLNLVNSEAKPIHVVLVVIESPYIAAKKYVEDEEQRIKDEELEKETARIEGITEKIGKIKNAIYCSLNTQAISSVISDIVNINPEDGFDEFSDAATLAKEDVLKQLEGMLLEAEEQEKQAELVKAEAIKQEEERKKLEEARAEIDRYKAEVEAEKQKVADEILAIEKAKEEEVARIQFEKDEEERKRIEEGERIAREEIEAEQIAYKAAMEKERKEEEAKRIKEDRERFNTDAVELMKVKDGFGSMINSLQKLRMSSETETVDLIDAIVEALNQAKVLIEASPIYKSQGW